MKFLSEIGSAGKDPTSKAWRALGRFASRTQDRSLITVLFLAIQFSSCIEALEPVPSVDPPEADAGGTQASGKLKGLFEPSGVQQLPDGRFVVVEDEAQRPFTLLSFDSSGLPTTRRLDLAPQVNGWVQLNDLEGITSGEDGFLYAITSHSLTRKGKRDVTRERLVRFKIDGDELTDFAIIGGLRGQIAERLTALGAVSRKPFRLSSLGLNIEGLAFDPVRRRLLIGLRAPLKGDKAIIFTIANPAHSFNSGTRPVIESTPLLIDLDAGGIRGLAFDSILDGFLVLSRSEQKKGKHPFKLWYWRGDQETPPQRLRLASRQDLEGAEGVAPGTIGGVDQILVVRDDGNASKGKAAHYLRLNYPSLPLSDPGDPAP